MGVLMEDKDLAEMYRVQAAASIDSEAAKRIAETADPVLDARLRATPLASMVDTEQMAQAIIARLGIVRAALDGHGGGIKVEMAEVTDDGVDLILNLDGACIACGAAPGTLQGIQSDLLEGGEVFRVRFSSSLLDSFDELGRDFVLKHGGVTFV
jgi:Fe-S cluster biogenesis protein NfuA